MNEIITEKNYPVQGLWILKSILSSVFMLIFFLIYFLFSSFSESGRSTEIDLYFAVFVGFAIFLFFATILRRFNFHYSIEKKFLTLKQGVLSKQQRYIPYGVIQNLLVKQDLFDRIFGLASLRIENAAQGAGILATPQQPKVFGIRIHTQQRQRVEIVGFSGNSVNIPGLKKMDAETLKEIVLQKMKENPIEDSQSGL